MTTLLVANRGEIAIRILRTARDLGIRTVAVFPRDDAGALHARLADVAVELSGLGPRAYLDGAQLVEAAAAAGADLVHPGYGFLAESPEFARACGAAGLTFLGPSPEALSAAGSKTETHELAASLAIPVPDSTGVLSEAGPAIALLAAHPAGIVLKAVAGGGGRGIAVVHEAAQIPGALARCRAEAQHGFGDDRVFAQQLFPLARHIEVQGIGGPDGVRILGDRDCSLQRRRQKVVEIAPAPGLTPGLRRDLHAAAQRLLESLAYTSLATVEFLVREGEWVLLEINPRIQVEHTVTEAVTGLDLVACQVGLGLGHSLAELGVVDDALSDAHAHRESAIQLRISAETIAEDGTLSPASGTIDTLDFPTGHGVRVDTWVHSGSHIGVRYDTLLAKLIVTGRDLRACASRAERALDEFRCSGVATNAGFLAAVLSRAPLGAAHTGWIDEQLRALLTDASDVSRETFREQEPSPGSSSGARSSTESRERPPEGSFALASGEVTVNAPLSGTVVSLEQAPGELGLIEAMKMHHPIPAPAHTEARPLVTVGTTVARGEPVFAIRPLEHAEETETRAPTADVHPGVDEVIKRHEHTRDEARVASVAKIHARNRRTARENLADLLVPGSFVEYGPLAIAAQTARRSVADLVANTSGDGIIGGVGSVRTPAGPRRAVVMSYDYMVLAGTQGARNHAKTDRLLSVARSKRLPVVLFAEGGGGRPGDTDVPPGAHLNVLTFASLAALKGVVPIVSIVSGRCFAGNAALAGIGDVIIATAEANLGMGGPAMIEGGGLGRWSPEEIGPASLHATTGAVDAVVADDAAAVAAAQQFLGLVSREAGSAEPVIPATAPPQALARAAVPGNRLRAYDMRALIETVVDVGSFFELRREFAPGAVTGFARVAGRAVGVIANDNHHLGGAIDVDAARSFIELLEVADAHGLPVVSFVDTPGFIVGPEAEQEPGVKVFGRLFTAGAKLSVPIGAVIVRKAYGLGAMAMAAGSLISSQFTVAWPSGELGPMGLEGAVRLGFAKELAAIKDEALRAARYDELVAAAYEQGRAMTAADLFDVDDVIDPADTRSWIMTL